MSNLVIIRSKFYDQSGARVINLQVKSRYQGSQKENLAKTDSEGFLYFRLLPIEQLKFWQNHQMHLTIQYLRQLIRHQVI